MPGEFDFIQWLTSQQTPSTLVPVPAGDDLAILNWPNQDLLLAGVDQVLDGVHFDSTIHSPRQIGQKVMNRNLSDCAAMACLPAAAVVSAALPKSATLDYAKELYLGMKQAGEQFNCPIVGGDTASWPGKLSLSVTILGRSAGIAPVRRNGAAPNQPIYVTGPLGGSILGRHMTFTPRIQQARQFAAASAVSSMIDLSDGLSRDLTHLCRESNVGAILFADKIPIHPDVAMLPPNDQSPLSHALNDGEDYELLLTASQPLPAIQIGITTADPTILLRTKEGDLPLKPGAWEHRIG